jgi:hypothetical protein
LLPDYIPVSPFPPLQSRFQTLLVIFGLTPCQFSAQNS